MAAAIAGLVGGVYVEIQSTDFSAAASALLPPPIHSLPRRLPDSPELMNQASENSVGDEPTEGDRSGQLIEIGLVIVGQLDQVDRAAVRRTTHEIREHLEQWLPEFSWQISVLRRPESTVQHRQEPSDLLQQAADDRHHRRWDFALLVTAAELVGYYRPFCFAALSRPLDAAVISTALIDPRAAGKHGSAEERTERVAARLLTLMLGAVCHLTGVPGRSEPTSLMYHPGRVEELDQMRELGSEEKEAMAEHLREVADLRLEEDRRGKRRRILFAMQAAWINRDEIFEAVVAARPWQFPQRLSRLTTAAVSTSAILLMTAEAWDLGLSQPVDRIVALACAALLITTVFVTVRQQLLLRRGTQSTEQTVVTAVSAFSIVATGMAATWLAMTGLSLLVATLLFNWDLVAEWAASTEWQSKTIKYTAYAKMSFFTASLAILIGALGASFEPQGYFRHVIFVDEEI